MLILVLTLCIYACLISWFIVGWRKTKEFIEDENTDKNSKATIVVACKNEAQKLPHLLQALANQSNQNFQLILVDDNSTDNSFEIMQLSKEFSDMLILKSTGIGKKQALKTGIEQASNELIITTDADCLPVSTWLQSIYAFHNQYNPDLIIGPVEIKSPTTFFESLQQLEFQTLIASGAGAAGNNQAIMCNGANLAFHKSDWLAHYNAIKPHLQSGDDVFLLHTLKHEGRNIQFLKSKKAMVFTSACSTLKQFYKQRKRWASKAPSYSDTTTIIVALIILGVNSMLFFLAIASIINHNYIVYLLVSVSTKFLIDWYFIGQTNHIFENKKTVRSIVALTVVYPLYIVISAFAGIAQGLNDKRKDSFQ